MNLIVSSKELHRQSAELFTLTKKSIVNFMRSKGITNVDLTLDQFGRSQENDDYDKDWVFDNSVYVECYGRCSYEYGAITNVEINEDNNIVLTADSECATYTDDCIVHTTNAYIGILERLEMIYE